MKKIIAIFLVIGLIVSVLGGCSKQPQKSVEAAKKEEVTKPVEVSKPEKRDIKISQTLSGKLSAIEDIVVTSELSFPAKVKNINVEMGDKVSKGEILFTLDDEDIKKQIEQAQAAYDTATWNLKSTEEQMENAKVNLERMEKLFKEGAISKQQYEDANLRASDTSLNALKAQVNQAKISLDQATSELEKTVIKSPISGYVASINIDENEFAPVGQAAMRIVNTDKFIVDIDVAEQIINKIKPNQKVDVKVNVATDETLEGIVKSVSPVPDEVSQIYPIEIEIENKDGIIKAGMFAEVIFDIEKSENALSLPSDAIKEEDGTYYVYTIDEDKAMKREIQIGLEDGKYTEILEGINEDDEVIVKGHDYVDDGEKVRIVRGDE